MSVDQFFKHIPIEVLDEISKLDLNITEPDVNEEMNRLLQKTVLVGGKRLRPLLTFLMGNLFDVPFEKLSPLARGIELVHAASLCHDDVVDSATTRRGTPSINIVAGNKKSVLAGDYLLADVIVSMTREGDLNILKEMSEVIQTLSDGEWIQLNTSNSRKYTRDIIETIAMKKTGSVLSWCCLAPAFRAGHATGMVEYARQFGVNIGVAFQLIDDTLDFSDKSNKDHLLDMENGIVNSVIYEWLELNPDLHKRFISGENISSLWNPNHLDEAIKIVHDRAFEKLNKASEILDIIHGELGGKRDSRVEPLKQMLKFLAARSY